MYEQEVEDINSIHKIDNHLVRRLIVMPLTDDFKPSQVDLMHEKIQYGDKCSLPTSIGRLIFEKRFDVPWLFELTPVRKGKEVAGRSRTAGEVEGTQISARDAVLDKVYISPLDFRAPENYIFLPQWMMKCLDLHSNDIVDISFVRIKLAELVVFQPLTLEWDTLMATCGDPKVLLEHEINKYSSLTSGSTIKIAIKGTEYPLLVKDTVAEGGVSVAGSWQLCIAPSCELTVIGLCCMLYAGVRVQDSDIKTDIDRSVLDQLRKEMEKEEEGEEEQEQEQER